MKKTLIIVLIIGVVFGVFYFLTKKEAVAPEVIPPVTAVEDTEGKRELCFAKFSTPDSNGFYDRYTLRLILDGEKATGELNFLPAEKDSKTGEIEGTVSAVDPKMMARTASLWWFTFAEGMSAKEELKIIFGEGTASVGLGEMKDRGDGVYVYKDPKNISYKLELNDVACMDLQERANVEVFLRENISELSPVKAVLGGTWYVVSMVIDLKNNSGTVTYEDGHLLEKKSFSYTVNDQGEIMSLTIQP